MMKILESLNAQGLITFPKQNLRWSSHGRVRTPAWVGIELEVAPRQDFTSISWTPELSFCAEMRSQTQLEVAAKINEFLIRRRHSLKPVPLRERSLEIFGDEKRLDSLVRAGCLFGGKLPLSAIGAIEVPFPLPYQAFPGIKGPVLVIENHHTFWSFCEWNKEVSRYSAIIYGGGNMFFRGALALKKIATELCTSEIQYFGDIDPSGFAIPIEFNGAQNDGDLAISVRPANVWYTWLIEHGHRRSSLEPLPTDIAPKIQSWFLGDPELCSKILELLRSQKRIPQESLSYEQLVCSFL